MTQVGDYVLPCVAKVLDDLKTCYLVLPDLHRVLKTANKGEGKRRPIQTERNFSQVFLRNRSVDGEVVSYAILEILLVLLVFICKQNMRNKPKYFLNLVTAAKLDLNIFEGLVIAVF